MRLLSANIQAAILEKGEIAFYMFRLYDRNGDTILTSTTFFQDVILSNSVMFEANDILLGVDAPKLSTTVDRERFKVLIADNDLSKGSLIESNLVGKKMEVYLGFVNPTTGLPFTNVNDTLLVYRGTVDSNAYKINTAALGEVQWVITGASPILSLDQRAAITLSRDSIRQRNPLDSCCDDLFEGSAGYTIKWGKS
jgi:hypothetical protein